MPNSRLHPHEAEAIEQFATAIQSDKVYGPYCGLNVTAQAHAMVIDEAGVITLDPDFQRSVAYAAFVPGWFADDEQKLSGVRLVPAVDRGYPGESVLRHQSLVSNILRTPWATDFRLLTDKFVYDGITGLVMRGRISPQEGETPQACVVASIVGYGDQLSRGVEADVYSNRLANLTSVVGCLAVVIQTEGFKSRVLYGGQELECR